MSKKEIKKLNGYQTKERQKQLKKNEQRNQIYSLEGFDKLKFKVLVHLRKNHFTSEPIDITNIKDFDKDYAFSIRLNSFNAFTEKPLSWKKITFPFSSIKTTLVFLDFSFPVNLWIFSPSS